MEPPTYNVFINYRGLDTKTTLAIPIYDSLCFHRVDVFMAAKSIQKGPDTSHAIRRAIDIASIYVVLISKHYADSKWCLNELCSILKLSHKRTIIPVFSDVEHSDLRNIESGSYAKAFQKHKGNFPMEMVDEWKKALGKVSDISSFIFKTRESDPGNFVENIVNIVLKVVRRGALERETSADSRESLQQETSRIFSESLQPETYQVFISHRGCDAKLTHASLIYHSLRQLGLRVFLDQKELRMGDTVSPAIEGAIRSASVNIVIFSNKYAESGWCLDELCWILKSVDEGKATMVCMFYDVEPANLRDITRGPYAAGFEKHKKKGRDTEQWKKALREAADISGIVVKTNKSDYGMYLEQIVRTVFTKVKQREKLEVAAHPVGLDEATKDFENKIGYRKELKETKIVVIAGMCSLGKSTLAKHLYNEKRFDFTRYSILLNVKGRNLPCLQEQLIRDLLMDHDLRIDNTVEGKGILQRCLPALRALIVLDDVDDIEQIHSLLDMDAVGSGSLILLTSCDKNVLRRSSSKVVLYDVKPLNRQHAHELFCHHAFSSTEQVPGFEHLVEEFLKICGGLPSSLQVLGRHLAGNHDKTYWKLQLEMFSRRLPDDIINTLKVSYEALKKEEKEMFLDIGCFLVGEDRELAVQVLEGLGYSDVRHCLESLRQKCLVEYNQDVGPNNDVNYKYELSRVMVHIQVKGLARHIAREEFFEFAKHKPLRLSSSTDLTEMLQLQDGSESCLTRGIRIPRGQNPPQLTNDIHIRGVRLLVVEHPMDLSSFSMSGNLVWLRLNNFPIISIPSTISLASLRVLELHDPRDHLQLLAIAFEKLPCKLRKLKSCATGAASGSASSSCEPFDVEHYVNRCRHIFNQQGSMTYFPGFPKSFPIDFRKLKNLRYLDLSGCTSLTKLPNSFSELLHLQYLSLQYCINLSIPIDTLGEISTLEYVDFKGCTKLVHLPEGMTYQKSLVYLNLEFCFELETLPDLSNLEYLKFLNMNCCFKLQTLNLKGLRSLEKLNLEFCPELKTLTNLSNLAHLRFLNINDCAKLETLNLEGLISLEYLNLKFCSPLNTKADLSGLERLKFLSINECSKMKTLNLKDLKALEYLNLESLMSLEGLNAEACSKLKKMTLSNLEHLRDLEIFRCAELETLNLEGLKSLECLSLQHCWELKSLPVLSNLQSLKVLTIEECVNLKTLNLEGHRSLESLGLIGLRTLENLNLKSCSELTTLTNHSNLENLKFLNINGCVKLETLNLEGLRSLEQIKAEECWKLNHIKASDQPKRLNCLQISTHNWWVKLETKKLEDLRSLKQIKAEAGWKLKSIEELVQREQLKSLQILTHKGRIWNDAFQVLTSVPFMSTAIFSGNACHHMQKRMGSLLKRIDRITVLDVPTTTTVNRNPVWLHNVKSHDAICMCFITSSLNGGFRVGFEVSKSPQQFQVYDTLCASGSGGPMLHIFMWTRNPKLPEDQNYKVIVYHSKDSSGNGLDAEGVDKGWIVTATEKRVLEVCKQVVFEFGMS